MAPPTKAKIRNLMSALFNHAIRYEWLEQGRNPILFVRQSAKRQRIPECLEPEELRALLSQLDRRFRVMVLLDAASGLRRSELLALKWSDVDFDELQINVRRSIYLNVIGNCKTEASRKPVPMDPMLASELWSWKQDSPYRQSDDWLFASPRTCGRNPYWPDSLLAHVIRPAALRAGIGKHIGWHTFRHYVPCLTMSRNGEPSQILPGEIRCPPAKPADMTRHSFLLAADSSGRRGVSPQVYSDPAVRAARMFSKLSASLQSSLPDEFVGFQLVRDQATRRVEGCNVKVAASVGIQRDIKGETLG
jgi:integrase